MYFFDTKIRVSYADTDKMGFCYYGNYSRYYEIARTELLRSLGISYKEIEDSGILLPVITMCSNFKRPAFYDELLTVRVILKEVPRSRIKFEYEIYNENSEIINTGETELAFLSRDKLKPQPAPDYLIELFEKAIS
ncbi:MAG: acyl-CoA thioesterase [Bacteroidia bacterium]|nr:acyl-CoA thioesterase [Bacteroidia bacterium]